MKQTPIPLTVIGGFLGAGKTSAVNAILDDAGGRRLAVLLNDFGDLALDATLVEHRSATIIGLANGCVCCSLVSGLAQALIEVLAIDPPLDHIVVEASGVSDPRRIADIARADPDLAHDATVVLVAADQWQALRADRYVGDTVTTQIASADILVQNKVDLVTASDAAIQRAELAGLAPRARLVATKLARLPADLMLGGPILDSGGLPELGGHYAMRDTRDHKTHDAFSSRTFRAEATLDGAALSHALNRLPAAVLRAKGLVRLQEAPASLLLVQAVASRWSLTPFDKCASAGSSLVVIGASRLLEHADLSELRAVFDEP